MDADPRQEADAPAAAEAPKEHEPTPDPFRGDPFDADHVHLLRLIGGHPPHH